MGDAGEAPENPSPTRVDGPPRHGWRFHVRVGGIVTTVAAIVAALATIVALTFQVDPGLAPCLGGREAHFTGAPVFPQYPYRSYLADIGHSTSGYPKVKGVEVRVSYQAGNLRGQRLVVRATLVRIGPGGEISGTYTTPTGGGAIPQDATLTDYTPDKCSQLASGALWVLPPATGGRWEFVLELLARNNRSVRFTLGHTPVFRG
jgi:hypothetical protein